MTIQSEVQGVESKTLQAGESLVSAAGTDISAVWSHLKFIQGTWLLLLVLLLGGFGAFVFSQSRDASAALTKANDDNKQLQLDVKSLATQWSQGQKQVAANQVQTQVIEKIVHVTDVAAQQKVAEVTAPDKTISQVQDLSTQYLAETPTVTDDQKLAFKPPTVQGFVATKIEKDELNSDLEYTEQELKLADNTADVYKGNLQSTQGSLTQALVTVNDQKAVIKHAKLITFRDRAIAVGAIVLTYFLASHK